MPHDRAEAGVHCCENRKASSSFCAHAWFEIQATAIVKIKIGFFMRIEMKRVYFRFDFAGALDLTGGSFLFDSILGVELCRDSDRTGRSKDGAGFGLTSLFGF